ncbi:hypothetical protein AAON49_01010 [Pseudotenacibaculum sp. MALMAid0570]|uniref:hypothetical protein n=1 Tax=Pseudotenacibaculum sp. MALMAid0570 TaxID=3143938 RepID=UPI0032DE51D7
MKKSIVISFFILATMSACFGQSSIKKLSKIYKVTSEKKCQKKGGYWYKNKCWANFLEFDDGISKENIDTEVDKQIKESKNYGMKIDDKKLEIDLFFPEVDEDSKEITVVTLFTEGEKVKTLLQIGQWDGNNDKSLQFQVMLFNGNLMDVAEDESKIMSMIVGNGSSQGKFNEEKEEFIIKGSWTNDSKNKKVTFDLKAGGSLIGMGNTTLEIKGSEAFLNGTLGTKSYKQFKEMIANHPEVKTVILENVPGSINDAVNMHTGRIIREAGLTTKVVSSSKISSGGVDIFCAGKKRIIIKGAQLGIHSWGGGDGITADKLPKDHPAHQYQLEYFTMCLGKEKGPKFYFHTLESAPLDGMHWMTAKEIKEWEIATRFIE